MPLCPGAACLEFDVDVSTWAQDSPRTPPADLNVAYTAKIEMPKCEARKGFGPGFSACLGGAHPSILCLGGSLVGSKHSLQTVYSADLKHGKVG
jgi:hypothetical protein